MSNGLKDALTEGYDVEIVEIDAPILKRPAGRKHLISKIDKLMKDHSMSRKTNVSKKEELKEGTKYDNNKPRLDLVPPSLEEAVGEILTMGAAKYSAHNWKKGINYSRIVASLKRHLNEFYKGNLLDKESNKPHLWHAACNIAFLIEFESNNKKYISFNDIHGNDK